MVKGKIALVTGGGGGIGRATCQVLARDGAIVVAGDLNIKSAEETIGILTGQGHKAMLLDVTKQESVDDLFDAIISHYGSPPAVIVNSAGILRFSPFLEETADLYDKQFNINVKGTFFVTQKACKKLKEAGIPGSVVNISSIAGKGVPCMIAYGITKASIECFSKAVGREMAEFGIRCNVVCPGPIKTPLADPVPEDYCNATKQLIPMHRFGEPGEVAEMIGFLSSNKSSYINSAAVNIDGGY
uniref:Uncharacterized protein n=1 Tax=Clastoptera arizonana TaxID=38151 RepID=A0A1B6C2R0_9HEMI